MPDHLTAHRGRLTTTQPSAHPARAMTTLITSRPLDEYCRLFGLTRRALRALPGPVLDCPGGAAGLVAEANALGCRAVAADPLYAMPPADRAALLDTGRATTAAAAHTDPTRYLPPGHRSPDTYLRSWDRARRLFIADTLAHPERYVAAELPALPFANDTFTLTLSSYLLFAYPEIFTPADQLAAMLELVRVTSPTGEVRIHPLHDSTGRRCPHMNTLRHALGRHAVSTEIIAVRSAVRTAPKLPVGTRSSSSARPPTATRADPGST